jgi:hypothetical protein
LWRPTWWLVRWERDFEFPADLGQQVDDGERTRTQIFHRSRRRDRRNLEYTLPDFSHAALDGVVYGCSALGACDRDFLDLGRSGSGCRGGPVPCDATSLEFERPRELIHRKIWANQYVVHDGGVAGQHVLDGLGAEQRGVVLHLQARSFDALHNIEAETVDGTGADGTDGLKANASGFTGLHEGLLVEKAGLEGELGVAGVQLIQYDFEGHLLMVLRVARPLAGAAQHVACGFVAADGRGDDLGICEKADDVLDFGLQPVGGQSREQKLLAAGESRKEDLKRGEQDFEVGQLLHPAEVTQAANRLIR